MSDAQLELDLSQAQEEDDQWTLEDLTHFWMSDGLPVFIAEYDNICDIIESMGFSIYYLLGNVEKTVTPPASSNSGSVTYNNNNKTAKVAPTPVKHKNMQLFRIVNNFVGRTVTPVANPFDDSILSLEEEAIYNMPAIPHILIDKLDQFFRLVDAQHGTESIVMLTYDLDKEGPDGWGILVPDQVNTSVHCNYDPHSIAEVKPDNVMIVGSVHSHPGMSAYASGTDHKDQADFDGIHITFGWQKSVNNGATQYYIEMQMAGKAYKLDPEDVFEDLILNKAPDPDVVEWSGKVKKVSPPKAGGSVTAPPTPAGQAQLASTQTGTTSKFVEPDYYKKFQNIPDFEIEEYSLIVAEVDVQKDFTSYCPSCESGIDDYDVFHNYCEFCMLPLTEKDTPVAKLLEDLKYYCKRFNYGTNVPVYLWGSDLDKNQFLIRVTPTTLSEYIIEDDYNEIYESTITDNTYQTWKPDGFTLGHFVVDSDDVLDFESATKHINVYEKNTKCSGCEFYYDTRCPFYKEQIVKYLQDRTQNSDVFADTVTGKYCNFFVAYGDNPNSYGYGDMYD